MSESTRFWFKSSEFYLQGPYTLAGVLASSWEEATALLIAQADPRFMIPGTGFLSCNVEQVMPRPCTKKQAIIIQGVARRTRSPAEVNAHEAKMRSLIWG